METCNQMTLFQEWHTDCKEKPAIKFINDLNSNPGICSLCERDYPLNLLENGMCGFCDSLKKALEVEFISKDIFEEHLNKYKSDVAEFKKSHFY